jgi:putative ABC transport system permease protein
MFLIASLLLNTGLLVFSNFGSFFDNITKELNASKSYYAMPSSMYTSEVKEYLVNNSNIKELQVEDIYWGDAILSYQEDERDINLALLDANKERTLSKWKFIGEHLPAEKMSIYIPYIFHLDGGYELNDTLQIKLNGKDLSFTVKGFVEDIFLSSLDTGLLSGYVPHETFELIANQLCDEKATLIFTNEDVTNSEVEKTIRELSGTEQTGTSMKAAKGLYGFDLSLVEMSRVFMSSIISIVVVVFAAIIVLVNLIVVRFRIRISIIDDMTKIGSLKAVGYTSRQIMLSMAYQYTLIAFAGSAVGIVLSYLVLPVLSDVFAVQSGLKWEQGFDVVISSITLIILLIITMFVAFLSSRRVNKLTPIVALRGGIITHSFRKNPVPLHKAKGRLTVVLAMKGLLQSKKQSMMIALIVIAISFAGAFAVIMYYNTTIETKTFAETPGIELSNISAVREPGTDSKLILEDITQLPGVKKTQYLDELSVTIEDNELKAFVMEDFSEKETDTVYEGRYPIHSNEIVLAGRFAEQIHKGIRDTVIVEAGESKEEFLITGLSQGSYMGGMNVSMRLDGMQKLTPDLDLNTLHIYLEKGEVTSAEFAAKLESSYADVFVSVTDMDKQIELGMGMYADMVGKVGLVILVITVLVDVLVLYFVINSSVVRKKRDLGIQKAIGFTTFQLMNQLSLGFLPPVILGVSIGSFLGISQGNNIMSLAQRSMGIMKANYIIKPFWILLFGATIVFISYVTSMLITYRVRKISAYALVTE